MSIRPFTREIPKAVPLLLTKRQQRYRDDDIYRHNAKTLSRRAYRRRVEMEIQSCLYSLEFFFALAKQ